MKAQPLVCVLLLISFFLLLPHRRASLRSSSRLWTASLKVPTKPSIPSWVTWRHVSSRRTGVQTKTSNPRTSLTFKSEMSFSLFIFLIDTCARRHFISRPEDGENRPAHLKQSDTSPCSAQLSIKYLNFFSSHLSVSTVILSPP